MRTACASRSAVRAASLAAHSSCAALSEASSEVLRGKQPGLRMSSSIKLALGLLQRVSELLFVCLIHLRTHRQNERLAGCSVRLAVSTRTVQVLDNREARTRQQSLIARLDRGIGIATDMDDMRQRIALRAAVAEEDVVCEP